MKILTENTSKYSLLVFSVLFIVGFSRNTTEEEDEKPRKKICKGPKIMVRR